MEIFFEVLELILEFFSLFRDSFRGSSYNLLGTFEPFSAFFKTRRRSVSPILLVTVGQQTIGIQKRGDIGGPRIQKGLPDIRIGIRIRIRNTNTKTNTNTNTDKRHS